MTREDDIENEDAGALRVLTILDLSEGVAGPFAGQLFADYGARVIKVERPGKGDATRAAAPFAGEAGPERSAVFLAANAGKLSLTLDYETPDGAAILRRLAEEADGIIEDAPTRRRADLGLAADDLIAHVPRLVIGQVANLDAAWDHETQSRVGLHVFLATLAGLWRAAQSEHGQVVTVDAPAALAFSAALPSGDAVPPSAFLRETQHPVAGRLAYPLAPFLMSETPASLSRPPTLAEHTDHVLRDLIGLEAAEIDDLRARGIA